MLKIFPAPFQTAAALAALAALAGCGSTASGTRADKLRSPAHNSALASKRVTWWGPADPIPGVGQRTVGAGAEAAVLLWRKGSHPSRHVVVFLHGLRPQPPSVEGYGEWIRHLTAEGDTVVYPVYETIQSKLEDYLPNALAGIRAGLDALHATPDSVVAIGHTTGGALAFDYAALAQTQGLPAPSVVAAVYPGRRPTGGFLAPRGTAVTRANLTGVPASTHLMVIAGPGDPIPNGSQEAYALLAGATKVPAKLRTFVSAPYIRSPGPFPKSVTPRRSFWAPVDRLIAQARAGTK